MDWKEMLEPVLPVLLQVGGLILVAVLVQMRTLVKGYIGKLLDKAEAEKGIIIGEAARKLLLEAVDVGIGSVQEMLHREKKEPGQGEITGEQKLSKAKDAIVSYLGSQGTNLGDLKVGDTELDDLIHSRLNQWRTKLIGKGLIELVK